MALFNLLANCWGWPRYLRNFFEQLKLKRKNLNLAPPATKNFLSPLQKVHNHPTIWLERFVSNHSMKSSHRRKFFSIYCSRMIFKFFISTNKHIKICFSFFLYKNKNFSLRVRFLRAHLPHSDEKGIFHCCPSLSPRSMEKEDDFQLMIFVLRPDVLRSRRNWQLSIIMYQFFIYTNVNVYTMIIFFFYLC